MNNLDAMEILRTFYDYDIENNSIRLGDYDSWWEWIHIKKTSDIIVFMPYNTWKFDKGVSYMTMQQYDQLRALDPQFPLYQAIPMLTKKDCAQIFLSEAPEVIRTHGDKAISAGTDYYMPTSAESKIEYKLNKKFYLSTDACEGQEIITILERMLKDYSSSQDPVILKRASTDDAITIILDTPDYFEWKALCKVDGGYCLRLEPGYKVLLS